MKHVDVKKFIKDGFKKDFTEELNLFEDNFNIIGKFKDDSTFVIHSEDVLNSFHLEEESFINLIGDGEDNCHIDLDDTSLSVRLYLNKMKISQLRCLKSEYYEKVSKWDLPDRTKKILKHSLNDWDDIEKYIEVRKYTTKDRNKKKTPVRVYVVCLVSFENEETKYYQSIFFIDPYHLALPSKFKSLTKDEYINHCYNKFKNNNQSLSDFFSN